MRKKFLISISVLTIVGMVYAEPKRKTASENQSVIPLTTPTGTPIPEKIKKKKPSTVAKTRFIRLMASGNFSVYQQNQSPLFTS
jgi:hypothetical protein